MIALTYKTAFSRFEYLLDNEMGIDEVIFLDYLDGHLLVSDDLIASLNCKTAIILIDSIHLNYIRLELYAKLRLSGVKFGNLISPHASIAPSVKLGENIIIHHGVRIDRATSLKSTIEIQENTIIKDHCTLGAGIFIGHHSYIESGVKIGSNVNLGNYLTLNNNVQIGSNVALEINHQTINKNVSSGTFMSNSFPSIYRYI